MCPWETESDDPIASKIVPRERRDGRQLKVLAALRGSQHPCDALVFRRFYADPPPALRSADQHLLHLPVSLLGSQASQEEPHFRPEYPLCPLRATLTTWVPASRDSCRHLLLEPGILSRNMRLTYWHWDGMQVLLCLDIFECCGPTLALTLAQQILNGQRNFSTLPVWTYFILSPWNQYYQGGPFTLCLSSFQLMPFSSSFDEGHSYCSPKFLRSILILLFMTKNLVLILIESMFEDNTSHSSLQIPGRHG